MTVAPAELARPRVQINPAEVVRMLKATANDTARIAARTFRRQRVLIAFVRGQIDEDRAIALLNEPTVTRPAQLWRLLAQVQDTPPAIRPLRVGWVRAAAVDHPDVGYALDAVEAVWQATTRPKLLLWWLVQVESGCETMAVACDALDLDGATWSAWTATEATPAMDTLDATPMAPEAALAMGASAGVPYRPRTAADRIRVASDGCGSVLIWRQHTRLLSLSSEGTLVVWERLARARKGYLERLIGTVAVLTIDRACLVFLDPAIMAGAPINGDDVRSALMRIRQYVMMRLDGHDERPDLRQLTHLLRQLDDHPARRLLASILSGLEAAAQVLQRSDRGMQDPRYMLTHWAELALAAFHVMEDRETGDEPATPIS